MEFNAACPFSALTLNSLRLTVRLGCLEDERRIPQYVRFDVRLRFSTLPEGCFSDELVDTACYSEISNCLRDICGPQEYRLIEKLGWAAYTAIKKILPPSVGLWVRVLKEKPPISNLEGGASFCVGDWDAST